MTTDTHASLEAVQALSERTRESMTQLRSIQGLPLPRNRHRLVASLITNAQTYLVFLEECAKRHAEGEATDASLLEPIQSHCESVAHAWGEVNAEFQRQGSQAK